MGQPELIKTKAAFYESLKNIVDNIVRNAREDTEEKKWVVWL